MSGLTWRRYGPSRLCEGLRRVSAAMPLAVSAPVLTGGCDGKLESGEQPNTPSVVDRATVDKIIPGDRGDQGVA